MGGRGGVEEQQEQEEEQRGEAPRAFITLWICSPFAPRASAPPDPAADRGGGPRPEYLGRFWQGLFEGRGGGIFEAHPNRYLWGSLVGLVLVWFF